MTTPLEHRRAFLQLLLAACVIPARGLGHQATPAGKSVAPNVTLDAATAAITFIPAATSRTRSRRQRKTRRRRGSRARRHLSSGGAGPGADLVQRPARRHHARGRGRRDAHRGQSRRSPIDGRTATRPSSITWSISATGSRARRSCAASGSPAPTTSRPARAIGRRLSRTMCARRRSSTRTAAESRFTRGPIPTIEKVEVVEQLHQPMRRRRLGRAPRSGAGVGAVPQLHLPRQPHPDHRLRVRRAARQPCDARELPVHGQHRQHGRRLCRACSAAASTTRRTAPAHSRSSPARAPPSAAARSPATGTAWTTMAPAAATWTRFSGRTR